MGIQLPFGLPLWPTAIAWLVAGIICEAMVADGGIRDSPILAVPVIAAGVVFGKIWGIVAGAGLIGVFRALWILFIFSVFIGLMVMAVRAHAKFSARGVQVQGQPAQGQVKVLPPPAGHPAYQPGASPLRVGRMYHATPEILYAMDIFENRRFMVGPSTPLGFYLSPNFDWISKEYGNGNGAVVEFLVGQDLQLREKGNTGDIYYYHTPNAAVGKYLDLPAGLMPVRVLDCNKNELRR